MDPAAACRSGQPEAYLSRRRKKPCPPGAVIGCAIPVAAGITGLGQSSEFPMAQGMLPPQTCPWAWVSGMTAAMPHFCTQSSGLSAGCLRVEASPEQNAGTGHGVGTDRPCYVHTLPEGQCRRRSLHRSGRERCTGGRLARGRARRRPSSANGGAVSHSAHSEERTSLETPTMNCLRAWTDPFAGDGRPIWLPSSS